MTSSELIRNLYSRLKPVQQQMFKAIFSSTNRKTVMHCARRLGKTHLLCVLALCVANKKADSQIRYASVTQKSVRKMVFPIFKELHRSIPAQFRGRWNSIEGAYIYKNGSMIHISGVNNGHADDLRGTESDLFLIDEAAFVDELSYLVDSVAIPQLLTVDGSKLVMASSSPVSPAHDFTDYISEARLNKSYQSYTIHDGGYSEELIAEFCAEAGGPQSTTWKREYLNEIITDDQMAVVPEWNSSYVAELPKSKYDQFYHRYESMDLGVRDKTAILFGYYRFDEGKLYIEAEWTCSGQDSTTRNIANNVKRIEAELAYSKVYTRVADNNSIITLQDLNNEFGLYFGPTSKDSLAAMVNEVRLWVSRGRIIVNPTCKELISCLEFGVYKDEKRDMFGRSKSLGHYDLLASLIYLVRNIDQHTNPIPKTYGYTQMTWNPNIEQLDDNSDIKKIFNI